MSLTVCLPLGVAIAVAGAILLLATERKGIAKVILGLGVAVTLLTLILIVLAVNSQM